MLPLPPNISTEHLSCQRLDLNAFPPGLTWFLGSANKYGSRVVGISPLSACIFRILRHVEPRFADWERIGCTNNDSKCLTCDLLARYPDRLAAITTLSRKTQSKSVAIAPLGRDCIALLDGPSYDSPMTIGAIRPAAYRSTEGPRRVL